MRQSTHIWPQVVEQILGDFEVINNATPEWLEVAETGRRLIVDRLYPRLGMAIWFKGYRHGATVEGLHEDDGRVESLLSDLCRQAGYSLVVIDAKSHISEQKLAEICDALNRSDPYVEEQKETQRPEPELASRIASAKATCQRIQRELPTQPPTKRTEGRWRQRRQRTRASWRQIRSNWRVFAENRLAIFGVLLLVVFALMAVSHPVLMATVWPANIYSPDTGFDMSTTHPSAPSSKHLLGTDTVGRDVLSVLLASTTPTFVVGLTAAITAAIIGTVIGAIAAYAGGIVDATSMQVADAFLLVPAPLLMIIVGSRFNDMGPVVFGLLYGVVAGLSGAAIVIRSHALTIMNKPFIEAARVAGGGAGHIMLRHLVPHLLPLAAIFMMITATGAVIADGFVSFLGITRTHHNWGGMIFWSFAYQATVNPTVTWNVLIPPAVAFSLFAASFYFISRGLQQIADPKLRQEQGRER